MKRKIGFIGAGNMGSRMANRLIANGHEVIVCDAFQQALEPFAIRGIRVTGKPAEAARSDIVILMVADDSQLLQVVTGPGGLLEGIDRSAPPLLMIMSTGLPKTMAAVRDAVASFGVRVIEAPVSGGVGGAERGTLSIMLGGDQADIDEAMPIILCMGKSAFRCGDFGSAQTVKLINNMIGLTNLYITAEAFELARKSGIDLLQLGPILEASTGRNFVSQDIRTSCFQYASWASTPDAFDSLSRIVRKDMHLAVQLLEDVGVDARVLKNVAGLLGDNSRSVFDRWNGLGALHFDDQQAGASSRGSAG
ncbi:MAG: NAD(P)-dependent oxidoreductase [Microcystis sp. LE19-4.1E]|jgi:3-hydroxyisobutyrate dehydrogenase|nr:NAD(P)-dependent oxidoreductase [Microcystis sp. LE19-4.1E]